MFDKITIHLYKFAITWKIPDMFLIIVYWYYNTCCNSIVNWFHYGQKCQIQLIENLREQTIGAKCTEAKYASWKNNLFLILYNFQIHAFRQTFPRCLCYHIKTEAESIVRWYYFRQLINLMMSTSVTHA